MTIRDKYIDPFTDFGFKHIFGTEENKRFLISFLNDLLDIQDKIIDIEYRNLEKLGLNIIDRRAIFDIYCTDEKNNNFIVKLQRSKQKYFKDRSLYYTSFPIQEQSKKGDWDYKLEKIYFVGILDFIMDDSHDDYLSKVELKDHKNRVFYNKLTYYYLEMPKFKKSQEELASHLEYWLFYLNHLSEVKSIPKALKEDKLLEEAFKVAEFLALDKDEQFAYQQDLKRKLDYKAVMDYAKEEAQKEGIKEGLALGIQKGEFEAKIKIAKSSLAQGIDLDTVALITGLSKEEIRDIDVSSPL